MKTPLPLLLLVCLFPVRAATADPDYWQSEWPRTDFSKHSVPFEEVLSGGPPKDGIRSIDAPRFVAVTDEQDLTDTEPVVGVVVNGDARAYPLRILIWHEIVNDTVGGIPVSVTFCPLCNAAIVYDRRIDGTVLDFGTTGKLRHSDLIMYDRQTESWWQQFLGEGIAGTMTGKTLEPIPARLESWANFKARAPQGRVLVPEIKSMRNYGANPYSGYDSRPQPFLYAGEMPDSVAPLSRVISTVKRDQAWSLALLQEKGEIRLEDGLVLRWEAGQNSALDTAAISQGADVGNVTARRRGEDVPYFVDFAFAFHAFFPEATIHGQ